MIFQSHVVNWFFFLPCPIILLGRDDCEEEAFLSTGPQIQRMSEPAVLPSAGMETTWVRDLSAWSGLISYFVKLDNFVILKHCLWAVVLASEGWCAGPTFLGGFAAVVGDCCCWEEKWIVVIHVDVKLPVKSLSAEYQYIGNNHLNCWGNKCIEVCGCNLCFWRDCTLIFLLGRWCQQPAPLIFRSDQ